jgi:membrane protease YdiL (CAAX protease family)
VSSPIEPQQFENEPAPPAHAGRKATLFDTIFLGADGVRAGWRAGVYVSLFFVLTSAAQLAAGAMGISARIDPRDMTPWPVFLQEFVIFMAALGAAAALGLVEGKSIGDYGLPWRRAFRGYFWQGVLWGFGEISALVILIAGMGGYYLGRQMLSDRQALVSGGLWAVVFLMVALAEEFAFRGYLLKTLTSGMGFWPAAILLSLGFGAVHMGNPGENPTGLLSVAAVGLFFCVTVRFTGDLWFAIGLHTAHDFAQAFVYSVPNSGTLIRGPLFRAALAGPAWLTGGAAGPEGSFLELAVLGFVFVLFTSIYYSAPAPTKPQD